jgi:hypothetical protein
MNACAALNLSQDENAVLDFTQISLTSLATLGVDHGFDYGLSSQSTPSLVVHGSTDDHWDFHLIPHPAQNCSC